MGIIAFLFVGLIAGWLAGTLIKGGGFGMIGDIVVGVLGAMLGGFLFGSYNAAPGSGIIGSIIVATIGAIILIMLIRLVNRRA